MNRVCAPQPQLDQQVHPIAVLGMHRSGTSCLTGLLEDVGVWLGPVSKFAHFNRKGNQENSDIVALHDGVLADNGASWYRPPRNGCHWQPQRIAVLRRILERYPQDKLWAFKDPRTCFTSSAWRQAIPRLRFIGTYRHPMAVAASLHHRNGMTLDQGVELWTLYNKRLIDLQKKFGFRLVCFDLEPAAYLEQAASVFRGVGLQFSTSSFSFFDKDLRTQIPNHSALLSSESMNLYRYLRELSG